MIQLLLRIALYYIRNQVRHYFIVQKGGSNKLFLLFFTLNLSYLVYDYRTVHIGGSAVHLLKVK